MSVVTNNQNEIQDRQMLQSFTQSLETPPPPAVSGAVQAAVVAAHLGTRTTNGTSSAGAGTGRLIQHGQVGRRGMGGGPLCGRPSGLPHDGCVGVSVQQLGKVWLLEHLSTPVDHSTAACGGGGEGQCGQGEVQQGGEWRGGCGSGVSTEKNINQPHTAVSHCRTTSVLLLGALNYEASSSWPLIEHVPRAQTSLEKEIHNLSGICLIKQ